MGGRALCYSDCGTGSHPPRTRSVGRNTHGRKWGHVRYGAIAFRTPRRWCGGPFVGPRVRCGRHPWIVLRFSGMDPCLLFQSPTRPMLVRCVPDNSFPLMGSPCVDIFETLCCGSMLTIAFPLPPHSFCCSFPLFVLVATTSCETFGGWGAIAARIVNGWEMPMSAKCCTIRCCLGCVAFGHVVHHTYRFVCQRVTMTLQ